MTDAILRKRDVFRGPWGPGLVGFCDRTGRRLETEGRFPKRFPIDPAKPNGPQGWFRSDIEAYLASVRARVEA